MTAIRARVQVGALIHTWLLLDFFGDSRRAGPGQGSSLTTTIMWQALLALVFALLLYPDVHPIPFAAANLCLSTLLIATGSLGDEERPLRRAADATLLAGAPVSRTTLVLARTGHAAIHLVLVTAGMALPPAILLAHLTGDATQAFGYVAAACCCSGLLAGSLAAFGAVTARVLGAARSTLLLGTTKALLLAGGFVLFALSLRRLDGDASGLPIGRIGAELLPMYHAARMLADPVGQAWRILPWAGFAGLLLLLTIASSTGEASGGRISRHQPLRALLRALAGRGPRLGIAEFVAATMWRSPGFRARVLPLLGLPAGMVFLTLGGERSEDDYTLVCLLLQLPAIYLPFLIAFLPRADQADTGWLFDHAPGLTHELVDDATWRALVTHVLMPTFALAGILVIGLGPERGERAAAWLFAFGLAVVAAERMTRLDRVPFSDDREADRGLDMGMLFTGALALGGAGTLFGAALPAGARWPTAVTMVALAILRLRRLPGAEGSPLRIGLGAPAGEPPQPSSTEDIVEHGGPGGAAACEGSVGRELRAIGVLYAVLSILPWLLGAAFAP
ncbi:MAG TPA: hypothetical protein ENI87_06585 [bacterium]|nr:hypothetical protein [bacterium]